MRFIVRTLTVACCVAALVGSASMAPATETSRWPSELEQDLVGLDAQLVEIQQRLFTAKQTNDSAGIELYTQQFDACQAQRLAILQSMGLAQPGSNDDE